MPHEQRVRPPDETLARVATHDQRAHWSPLIVVL
jgi:hypothetical protein